MTLNNSSLQKGLVLHLPMDQQSYNPATKRLTDKTPYENVGTSANAVSFVPDRMGQADRAMSFDGIDDYVDCGNDDSLSFGTGDFTVSYWLNSLYTGSQGFPLSKYDGTNVGWYIDINPPNVRFKVGGGTNQLINSVDVNIPDGNWHHVICLKTASNLSIYVDGVFNIVGGYNNENTNSSANLLVGMWDIYPISGSIADVRIYNRALSPEEVTALYEQYRPKVVTSSLQKGLVLHLPLDKESLQSATVFADKTPYENVGTSENPVVFVPDRMGQANRAMSFDGIDDYVDCGNDPSLDITDAITISAWVKLDSYSSDTCGYIIAKYIHTPYSLIVGGTTNAGEVRFIIGTFSLNSTSYLSLDTWYHLTGTYSGSRMELYINGEWNAGRDKTGVIPTNSDSLIIGDRGSDHQRRHKGSIADARIYNRALPPEEVTALYEQYRPKLLV